MPQIVVDNSAARKRQRQIKMVLLGAFGLLVLAVAAYFVIESLQPKPMDPTLKLLYAGRISYDDPRSQARLEQAAKTAERKDDKIALLQAAGGMAVTNKHYEQAEKDLMQAVEMGDTTAGTAVALAENYKNHLNKDTDALKYYRLALERTKADTAARKSPYGNKQIAYLEKQISDLEAKGVK